MPEVLQLEFMQNAIAATLLASLALGVVGTLVVVKREVFVSAGVAHASYGGVGLGFLLGADPSLLAMVVGVALALTMGVLRRRSRQRTDTLIGAMWAIGMASGVLMIDLTPGYTPDARSYLFGSLLTVPRSDIWFLAVLDLIIVVTLLLAYRPLLAYAFDPTFALVRGLPTLILDLALLLLVALTVVVLMRVTGLILLMAMLTIPPALAGRLARTVSRTMVLACLIGVTCSLVGLALSYQFDVTSGPAIVLVTALGYMLVTFMWRTPAIRRVWT